MNEKYKILDTNIFLSDPKAIYSFRPKEENMKTTIILPLVVLRELEKFKDERSERGRNAKAALKEIKEIIEIGGFLNSGIYIESNYHIKSSYEIEKTMPNSLEHMVNEGNDRILLEIVKKMKEEGKNVELVTLDISLIDIGNALGLPVCEWMDYKVGELYKGWREIDVGNETIKSYHLVRKERGKGFSPDMIDVKDPNPNEYFILKSSDGKKQDEVGVRYDQERGIYVPVPYLEKRADKVINQNIRQLFLMDALRNPDIDVVFAIGSAGSGKTFLATDAAMEQTIPGLNGDNKPQYQKMLITRPLIGINDEEDIGALPGELEEKLEPWLRPIYDQLDYLFSIRGIKDVDVDYIHEEGILDVQAMRHIRGRSLHDCFWIVDEAQNLTRNKLLTVGTRVSENSKLVFTGDPTQCDLKLVQDISNPIVYASNVFKSDPLAATVYFENEDCVRSKIASAFIERMGHHKDG